MYILLFKKFLMEFLQNRDNSVALFISMNGEIDYFIFFHCIFVDAIYSLQLKIKYTLNLNRWSLRPPRSLWALNTLTFLKKASI